MKTISGKKFILPEKLLIYEEVDLMGTLKHASGAIVDLIYSLSPSSCFVQSPSDEWVFRPRNWVALHFTRGKRLHVSLDVWPGNLQPSDGLPIKQGRYPQWSKITIERITDLEPAFHYIRHVWNGLP